MGKEMYKLIVKQQKWTNMCKQKTRSMMVLINPNILITISGNNSLFQVKVSDHHTIKI